MVTPNQVFFFGGGELTCTNKAQNHVHPVGQYCFQYYFIHLHIIRPNSFLKNLIYGTMN